MKTRSIIMVLTLILAGGVAHAQDLGAGSIKLILNGQSYGGTLTAQANPGPTEYTWTLPNASGTLALESSGTGWSTIGNTLGSTGLLGTLNNINVDLIANNQTRMTLLGGTAAVVLPTQTALRFGDAADGQYTALVSPTTLTGGSGTGNVTLILPDALPGGPDVRLQVKTVNSITGVVELEYSNPNTTGSIGFKQVTDTTISTSNANYVPVTGCSYFVEPNSIYSFETVVVVEQVSGNPNAEIYWGSNAAGAQTQAGAPAPAGVTILYYEIQLNANNAGIEGNLAAGTVNTLFAAAAPGNVYILKGYIRTNNTTPSGSVVQLRIRSTSAANQVRIMPTSSVQLITE